MCVFSFKIIGHNTENFKITITSQNSRGRAFVKLNLNITKYFLKHLIIHKIANQNMSDVN